jgi:hypothetical protein
VGAALFWHAPLFLVGTKEGCRHVGDFALDELWVDIELLQVPAVRSTTERKYRSAAASLRRLNRIAECVFDQT